MTQAAICPEGYISYTIQRNQTLYSIAQQFGTTVAEILRVNPSLDAQLYYAGDSICIPQAATQCPAGQTPYTVRRGDSFYLIARRYGIALADLLAANPDVDPARLMVGQVICVPGRGTACPTGYSIHTVTQGQTFVDILVLYNISYNALLQANEGLDLATLMPDQQVCIAPAGSRGVCEGGLPPYEIVQGDTLSTIAQRHNTTIAGLMVTNPNLTPSDFVAGRVICAPTMG